MDGLASVLLTLEGEHRGAAAATLGELTDYRAYQAGDDPRLVDWNAYARLGDLFVRTSAAREGLLLTLLIDCSRSMTFPGPLRLRHAKRLAAAYGAVALLHCDSVRLCALADGTAWPLGTLSGRAAIGPLLDELDRLPAGGGTDLAGSLRACLPVRAAGPTVLLSDLLVPDEAEALALLGAEGAVAHVTDPADADPLAADRGGTLEIQDGETGEVVVVTAALRARYADLWRARRAAVAARCAAAGLRYIRADTTTPVADILFGPAGPVVAS